MEPIPTGLTLPGADAPASGSTGDPTLPPRIAVVRNPRSHRNRGSAAQDPAEPNIEVVAPVGREALSQALARFATQGIELLIVDGGDGTMREVMSAGAPIFGASWPRLMVLPKGKTNALAIDLGMPGKCSLDEALRALPRARAVIRRPILLERQDCEARPVLGFIMGTGVFNVAIAAGQVAHRFGAFQGLAVAVTTLVGIVQALFGVGRSPWRAQSGMMMRTGDGRVVPHSRHGTAERRFAAGLSTLRKFPLGMKPFADAEQGIRYLVVDAPLRRVIALVPAFLWGLDRPFLRDLGVHRGAADELVMELDRRFILDGEAFAPGTYRLRLGPELQFLVP